jgi:transcriptional repressor NrdR
MRCPFCNSPETQVKDSRVSDDGSNIRRRRVCTECGARFSTVERVQLKEVMVKKSSGGVVPFERAKLYRSIQLACKKRPIGEDKIDKIVSSIQRRLESGGGQEVSSREIGAMVMDTLASIDKVAYIRFASVHRNFETREDFIEFIATIKDAVSADDAAGLLEVSYDKCALDGFLKK